MFELRVGKPTSNGSQFSVDGERMAASLCDLAEAMRNGTALVQEAELSTKARVGDFVFRTLTVIFSEKSKDEALLYAGDAKFPVDAA